MHLSILRRLVCSYERHTELCLKLKTDVIKNELVKLWDAITYLERA